MDWTCNGESVCRNSISSSRTISTSPHSIPFRVLFTLQAMKSVINDFYNILFAEFRTKEIDEQFKQISSALWYRVAFFNTYQSNTPKSVFRCAILAIQSIHMTTWKSTVLMPDGFSGIAKVSLIGGNKIDFF